MPFGVVALLVVAILVYFGVLHRVLDRMRLDDRTALLVLLLMIVGSFFNLTILRQPPLIINLGGAVVPIGVAVYLITTADTTREKVRGTAAAFISGGVIYLGFKLLNPEEQTMIIEPTYFYAIVAGVVGYLSGRSRRASFVAGTMGIVLADVAHYIEVMITGIRGQTWLGGAGVFDSVVIAGILAVGLAEVVGETREYMARGRLGSGANRPGPGRKSAPQKAPGKTEKPSGDSRRGAGGDDDRFSAALVPPESPGPESRRPATTGGAGWEPPLLGDSDREEGDRPRSFEVTEPDESVAAPGVGAVDLLRMDLDEKPGREERAGESGSESRAGNGRKGGARGRPARERRTGPSGRKGGGRRE